MDKAVIYARYSAGPNQTDRSIEGQISDCTKYAKARGFSIVGIYADKHVSGKSTEHRYEFQRMIKDAEKGLFDAVITWKVDRFGRDRYDIANNKRKLKKTGVALLFAKESIPDGPEGIILESVLEGLAEYYSADLAQKVSRGHMENAKNGRWSFHLPTGYAKDADKRIILDPKTAPIIREAYELYASGMREVDVIEFFDSKGITGANGRKITKTVVHRILRNRRYTGEFEFKGVKVPAPPIVSVELYDAVQRRHPTSRNQGSRKAKMDYLLSCKCYCAYCGGMLIGESGTSKSGKIYHYYKCGNAKRIKDCSLRPIPRDQLDDAVILHTLKDMLTDEMIGKLVDKIMEIQAKDDTAADIEMLQARITSLERKIDNIVTAIENGGGVKLVDRMSALESEKDDLEVELARKKIKAPQISREGVKLWLESFRRGDKDDLDANRKLVDTFVYRVDVSDGEAVIIFNATGENNGRCSDTVRLVD